MMISRSEKMQGGILKGKDCGECTLNMMVVRRVGNTSFASCACGRDQWHKLYSKEKTVVSKKQHTCCECTSVIDPGDEHEFYMIRFNGKFDSYRTCTVCAAVRNAETEHGNPVGGAVMGELYDRGGSEYETAGRKGAFVKCF